MPELKKLFSKRSHEDTKRFYNIEKEKKGKEKEMEIDWRALEEHWAKEYAEDYHMNGRLILIK